MDDASGSVLQNIRDPRYALRRLEVERRADGSILLYNPTLLDSRFETALGALEHWAAAAPARTWLAERSGDAWRALAFGAAPGRARARAAGLSSRGLELPPPLLSLA